MAPKSTNQTYVLVNVVQATVTWDESSDLLAVLNELNTDCLAHGRVWLLGLDTELLKNDSLCVRRSTKRIGLVSVTKVCLGIVFIIPALSAAIVAQLASCSETSRLAKRFIERWKKKKWEIEDAVINNKYDFTKEMRK